ncbi:MAG: transcription elongation factor GreA [Flavobacteriales bacterium]|jgi:transcription elongation factor GreA|uniref:transcription elongation factor GreA n=1 Tax=Blattabacterium sp. (Mastotermes darwiniensis) TaxID=39768 RepID=UPI000231DECC|nr:transcription elongation factor GreA [Blattabacterium sp. (Mastotermes darwiniensis)]AER40768.1 transcription elongation factor GreA [Blattabacterium sp. (Mastotermes darwiniensis) str. MADAR]MDR1804611.1 transcription elongation factor GreA [Flavobacteriales bacterium]
MDKFEYITKEGLKKLQQEIERLENIERPKISMQIAEARDKGDISENAEYDAIKEAQGFLEMNIAKLKKKLSNARIIDGSQINRTRVSILSTVRVKNLTYGGEQIYTLVPEGETDLKSGKISINTPISTGLLGKKVGQIAHIKLPNQMILDYEILEIAFSE